MKVSQASSVLALLLPTISARFVEENEPNRVNLYPDGVPADLETYLVELAPGETRWVTEDQKWELRRVWSRHLQPHLPNLGC